MPIQYKDFYNDISESYPELWNKREFENLNKFSEKFKYALTHLKKISSGSSRIVFKIDNEKVLKLAKNKRGLAQNRTESDGMMRNYDVTARTFDTDKKDMMDIGPAWVEMEFAKKVTSPNRFKQITGVDIKEIEPYLDHIISKTTYGSILATERIKELDNLEFMEDLLRLVADFDMGTGDVGRISSWGEVSRNGVPAMVLIDFGLTNDVYKQFYNK